jgi:hypothetical protein
MHTRFKWFSENLQLTHVIPGSGEYLCIFPQKLALKLKLRTPCITSQQECKDMANTEKLLEIKKTTHLK